MKYRIPTVREYLVLKNSESSVEVVTLAKDIAGVNSLAEFQCFLTEYLTEIDMIRSENIHLQVPYYPKENERNHYYNCNSADIKIVSDYTGLNFNEVYRTDIFTFWAWLHDAAVWDCEK